MRTFSQMRKLALSSNTMRLTDISHVNSVSLHVLRSRIVIIMHALYIAQRYYTSLLLILEKNNNSNNIDGWS